MKTQTILLALIASLALAATAAATPLPDASPSAHGRPVTVLPACPPVQLPWNAKNAYVEEFQHGVIVCASMEGSRFAATMTFAHHASVRNVDSETIDVLP